MRIGNIERAFVSSDGTRDRLVAGISYIFAGVGLFVLVAASFEAINQGRWWESFGYLTCWLSVVVGAALGRRFSYLVRVLWVVVPVYLLAAGMLLRIGLGSAGIPFLLTLCILATVLLGTRAGVIALGLGALAIGTVGAVIYAEIWSIEVNILLNSLEPESWLVAVMVFLMLGGLMVTVPGIILGRLEQSSTELSSNLNELAQSNESLQAEIRQREQTEQALADALAIISKSPIIAFRWQNADNWPVDFVSGDVASVLGYAVEEFISGAVLYASVVHPDDLSRVMAEVRQYSEQADRASFEHEPYRIVTKTGEEKWVSDVTHMVRNQSGEIIHFEGIIQDITQQRVDSQERKRITLLFRQQQKLESIGTLASGVAHEINNPINGIMNYAQLISDRLEAASPLKEYSGEILKESERVSVIVRNLLAFSRDEKLTHSPAEISDIVENTLSLMRTVIGRDQITLVVDVPNDLPKVDCRSQQIQQVLMNLIDNARDALNEKHPEYHEDKLVKVSVHRLERNGKRWLRTTVEDHGVGIAQGAEEQLFDPFFTTKPREKGTGLGLSISHGIVMDHGGELTFEGKPGGYTLFHVDLPVDNGCSQEDKPNGCPPEGPPRSSGLP
jgi:PAS domain S-box-containing protein